jgi:hypothetical protein
MNTMDVQVRYTQACELEQYDKLFAYEHLPPRLQVVSEPFQVLAKVLMETLTHGYEKLHAMRKLLEAKDCDVRAVVLAAPAKTV